MVVVGIGVVINGIIVWLFMVGFKNDVNIWGVFFYMVVDVVVLFGVVVVVLVMCMIGWFWLDFMVSLVIVVVIVVGIWGLFKYLLDLVMDVVFLYIDL